MQAAKNGRFTGGALKEAAELGGNEYDRYIQQLQHMAGFGTGAASGMGQAGAQFSAAAAAPYSAMMQAGGMEAAAPYQTGANLMQNLAFSRMMAIPERPLSLITVAADTVLPCHSLTPYRQERGNNGYLSTQNASIRPGPHGASGGWD
jgi:hypothetical protein